MQEFEIRSGVLYKYNGSGGRVVIPDGVRIIGAEAVARCATLTEVVIPRSVKSIGNGAFRESESLVRVVTVDYENGETVQGDGNVLSGVVIQGSSKSIGEYAFYECTALTEAVIPYGITSIENSAFYNCSSLSKLCSDAASITEFTIPLMLPALLFETPMLSR